MAQITVKGAIPRFKDYEFNDLIDIKIEDGNNVAIIGPNGAGKSLLVDIMLGNIALKEGIVNIIDNNKELEKSKVSYLSFRDIYRLSEAENQYYQQRWNATENGDSPKVADILKLEKYTDIDHLIADLEISRILDKRLIFLSSGEVRKLQIFKKLVNKPKLLIIDNPYIGLDAESRDVVNELLSKISKHEHVQIILSMSNPREIPDWIDIVLPVQDRKCGKLLCREEYLNDTELNAKLFSTPKAEDIILPTYDNHQSFDFENAIIMNKVSVKYYSKTILDKVDWRVKKGEKWSLLGRNGSGKSTLLSLVCGDNPQGYANDITLFDKKRGSGESIWEIKKRIGYLSPDMHTYYQENIKCIDVVASGYFDTIGLYRKPNDEQRELAMQWLKTFRAEHLAEKFFLKISYGEQRLILLTRVFVKNPPLIILDEPLHGLDAGKKLLAKNIIEKYCEDKRITLIYVTHFKHEIPECVTLSKVLTR